MDTLFKVSILDSAYSVKLVTNEVKFATLVRIFGRDELIAFVKVIVYYGLTFIRYEKRDIRKTISEIFITARNR